MLSAELRVYVNNSRNKIHSDMSPELDYVEKKKTSLPSEYHVYLYENSLEGNLLYVDSIRVKDAQEGWISLNVTLSLMHWLKHPMENHGLQLICWSSNAGEFEISLLHTAQGIWFKCYS